jgi:hypothetical protein
MGWLLIDAFEPKKSEDKSRRMVNSAKSRSLLEGLDVYAVAGGVRRRPLNGSWLTLFDCQKLNGHRPTMKRIKTKQHKPPKEKLLQPLIRSLIAQPPNGLPKNNLMIA